MRSFLVVVDRSAKSLTFCGFDGPLDFPKEKKSKGPTH